MGSSSKRRQTFAKMTREQKVREKRELKLEKKHAAALARAAEAEQNMLGVPVVPRIHETGDPSQTG